MRDLTKAFDRVPSRPALWNADAGVFAPGPAFALRPDRSSLRAARPGCRLLRSTVDGSAELRLRALRLRYLLFSQPQDQDDVAGLSATGACMPPAC